MTKLDLIEGEIIGNFTFIREDFYELEITGKQRYRKGLFQCNCGQKILTRIREIVDFTILSCGCLKKCKDAKRFTTHGLSKSITYSSWMAMKGRCFSKNTKYFKNYGGRGITVCEKWLKFEGFLEDMGERPSKEYSIERIHVNGNYSKDNCTWATRKQQDRNRRSNIYIEYNGENKLLTEWAKQFNLKYQTIQSRLKKGLSVEESFTKTYKYNKNERILSI